MALRFLCTMGLALSLSMCARAECTQEACSTSGHRLLQGKRKLFHQQLATSSILEDGSLTTRRPLAQEAALVEGLVGSAKSGKNLSKAEQEAIDDISFVLVNETIPDIKAAHDADQTALDSLSQHAMSCGPEEATVQNSVIEAMQNLAALMETVENASADLNSSQKSLSEAQAAMDVFVSGLSAPSSQVPSEGAMKQWFEDAINFYTSNLAWFQQLNSTLKNATDDAETKSTNFGLAQQQLEFSECYKRLEVQTAVASHGNCLTTIGDYNATVLAALKDQESRKDDFGSISKIQCFLKALQDLGNSSFIACASMTVDTSFLDLLIQEFDAGTAAQTLRDGISEIQDHGAPAAAPPGVLQILSDSIVSKVICPSDATAAPTLETEEVKGPYVAGTKGANSCPAGADPVVEDECLRAVQLVLPAGATQGRTTLQAGSWGWVPPGCSMQSGGDWAAHYNRLQNGNDDGFYSPVCSQVDGNHQIPSEGSVA